MKKALGYSIITDPVCGVTEVDTFTCRHCQKIVDKPPHMSATSDGIGGWCSCCDAPICLECVGKPCTPIERWLDCQEALRSYEENS